MEAVLIGGIADGVVMQTQGTARTIKVPILARCTMPKGFYTGVALPIPVQEYEFAYFGDEGRAFYKPGRRT